MPRRIALVAAVLALGGPGPSFAQSYPPAVKQLLDDARAQVKTLDMAALKQGLDRGGLGLLIDVREPDEFASGHLPGAINIPRGYIEFKIWPHVGYPERMELDRRITLYCGTGSRCLLAAKSLQDLKFTNVFAANINLEGWRRAGYPLVAE